MDVGRLRMEIVKLNTLTKHHRDELKKMNFKHATTNIDI